MHESKLEDEGLTALRRLHAEVDRETAPRVMRLGDRLQCRRGCHDCCRDELTVGAVEAHCIEAEAGDRLRGASPHAAGGCAFLDAEGACRIYAARPYICRTQGLPLRWFDPAEPGVERRDICPLNAEGPALERIADEDCWLLGPYEARLAALDAAAHDEGEGAPGERVSLRALFARLSTVSPR